MGRKPAGKKKRSASAGRKRRAAKPIPWAWWLALVVLAAAVGYLGGHVARRAPAPADGPRYGARFPRVEALLGPLGQGEARVSVADRREAEALLARLRRAAADDGLRVSEGPAAPGAASVAVRLESAGDAYSAVIRWPEGPGRRPPRLAIVIDDMGRDLDAARQLLDLDAPVTLSILPRLRHTGATARLARSRGRQYLLHLPMQPQGYPDVDPGPGALLEGMDEEAIRRRVREALEEVPGAAGVNNHMGSRLTEIEAPMGWVMDELKGRGLFFLDSVTTANSVAALAAREAGVAWARRDVFLDNVRTEEAVGEQLRKALERARRHGEAVAIGHPHQATLAALRAWIPRIREAGVTLVPVGDLARTGADGV
ncbi:MAG: hypothetical protein Kow0092_21270 [Deferrisomatales bacterium]